LLLIFTFMGLDMFFIRDCNDAIVGNPKGYRTMRGAQAQTSPRKPVGRAIWAAYEARDAMYEQTCMPMPLRRRNISSIRLNEEI
jgi:hypothetical protein